MSSGNQNQLGGKRRKSSKKSSKISTNAIVDQILEQDNMQISSDEEEKQGTKPVVQ